MAEELKQRIKAKPQIQANAINNGDVLLIEHAVGTVDDSDKSLRMDQAKQFFTGDIASKIPSDATSENKLVSTTQLNGSLAGYIKKNNAIVDSVISSSKLTISNKQLMNGEGSLIYVGNPKCDLRLETNGMTYHPTRVEVMHITKTLELKVNEQITDYVDASEFGFNEILSVHVNTLNWGGYTFGNCEQLSNPKSLQIYLGCIKDSTINGYTITIVGK